MAVYVRKLASSFDAITSNRPYREGLSEQAAGTEILRHRGTQFDPQVVDALLAAHQKGSLPASIESQVTSTTT